MPDILAICGAGGGPHGRGKKSGENRCLFLEKIIITIIYNVLGDINYLSDIGQILLNFGDLR